MSQKKNQLREEESNEKYEMESRLPKCLFYLDRFVGLDPLEKNLFAEKFQVFLFIVLRPTGRKKKKFSKNFSDSKNYFFEKSFKSHKIPCFSSQLSSIRFFFNEINCLLV